MINNFEVMGKGSEVCKVSTLRKVVTPVVALLALAGAGCTNNEQSDIGKYDQDKVQGVESIKLCDGARIRKDPRVPTEDDGNNTIHEVDFGDAPKGSCFEFDVNGNVYRTHQNPANGNWIGLPYQDMAELVDGFDEQDPDKIAWVNQAKADINESPEKQLIGLSLFLANIY